MWYRKANRIADLEARLEVALRNRPETPEQAPAPRRSVGDANRIHTLTVQRDAARQEAAIRTRKQVEYSNIAVANMRRLARALRACARYRADAAAQAAVIERLTEQVFDAIGYQPAERALLDTGPAHPTAGSADITGEYMDAGPDGDTCTCGHSASAAHNIIRDATAEGGLRFGSCINGACGCLRFRAAAPTAALTGEPPS